MKIGIIADIHSNIYGLKSVLKKLEEVDLILCAGDFIGYYTFVNEIFEEIKKRDIKCILGNHDAYLLGLIPLSTNHIITAPILYTKEHIAKENFDYLKNIGKASCELEIDNLKIKMYHGSPWDEFEGYVYPDFNNFSKFKGIEADLIILGHTHWPLIKKIDDLLIVNPGSCGQPRDYNPKASYAIFDTKTKNIVIERVKYDIDKVCEQARKENFDEKLIEILKRKK